MLSHRAAATPAPQNRPARRAANTPPAHQQTQRSAATNRTCAEGEGGAGSAGSQACRLRVAACEVERCVGAGARGVVQLHEGVVIAQVVQHSTPVEGVEWVAGGGGRGVVSGEASSRAQSGCRCGCQTCWGAVGLGARVRLGARGVVGWCLDGMCRSYYQITPDGQPDAVSETPSRDSCHHLKLCQPWCGRWRRD